MAPRFPYLAQVARQRIGAPDSLRCRPPSGGLAVQCTVSMPAAFFCGYPFMPAALPKAC